MEKLKNQLTEKDVIEALSQHDELLACYHQRLAMLSKEYEDAEELIEMLQLKSPGIENEGYVGGGSKGLDDIYLLYEQQKKSYQKEIHQNMIQIMESIDRVKYIYLYYLQLPPREQSILKAIYIEGKQYKEIIKEGLSDQTINRVRKRAIKQIIQKWETENSNSYNK